MYGDIAIPILSELTRTIEWPSDIHIIDGNFMRIIDSTRPLSPFHLYRGIVNRALSIFGSATGQSCLATMSKSRINRYVRRTEDDMLFGLKRFEMTVDILFEEIEKTRARKYGVRMPVYQGETVLDDGLSAIAVPVFKNAEAIGAISLLFPRSWRSHEAMAKDYLDQLTDAAERISDDLNAYV